MKFNIYAISFFLFFGINLNGQVIVTDADLTDGTYDWTNENEYILDGYVTLESGGVLNIQAGTVIKGRTNPSTGNPSSALIIARGAQIFATGTQSEPIIFTAEEDDLTTTDDVGPFDYQKWGGLVILGNGIIGEDGGTDFIEGIPSGDSRFEYGGNDNADNSGVLNYVSLRHGGAVLEQDSEINGLTLGGVGSGTTISYVEVFASKDDGIEIFGGAVNIDHAVVANVGDDCYDFDESWEGYIQYAFSLIQNVDPEFGGDHAIEYDGSEADDLEPKTIGRIYNATFIGAGDGMNSDNDGVRVRNDAALQLWNSIILMSTGYALRVDDTAIDRLAAGEGAYAGNIWTGYGELVRDDIPEVLDAIMANGNEIDTDPLLAGISRIPNGGLDPRLEPGSPALIGAIPDPNAPAGADSPAYRGAFGNSQNWALGWTAMDTYGYFGDLVTKVPGVVTDADIEPCETLTLTADTEWELDGYVFVEDCATLIIEAGTVIKARPNPDSGDPSSALIVSRGGTIIANGTSNAPIIFTSTDDDLTTTNDLSPFDYQKWGGVVILGNGIVGEDGGTDFVEGIPSGDPRAEYGGDDNQDSSGSFTYVSIRHGGAVLEQDNEINGLTLGGVGSGTTINHVEVFSSKDDGIEIFGGAVNIDHALVSYVGDDCYDFDESWDGTMQFIFSLSQNVDAEFGGDHAVEYDGSERDDLGPKTVGRIYNATFIGSGVGENSDNDGLRIRNDAAVRIYNSIVAMSTGYALRVDDTSIDRLAAGETEFANNYIFGYGELVRDDIPEVLDALNTNSNFIDTDAMFGGVSRLPDGGLDPRLNLDSPALIGAIFNANDDVIQVDYAGAFGCSDGTWAAGWSALDEYGFLGDLSNCIVSVNDIEENSLGLKTAPNPANDFAKVTFQLETRSEVSFEIIDLNGSIVHKQNLGIAAAGENSLVVNTDVLPVGTYIIKVNTEFGSSTQKIQVIK